MDKNIQVMAGYYLKLLVFFVVILNAQAHGIHNVSITILHSAVEKGAVCLDGSPPAYYHDKGYGKGAKNWVLFVQGGAWCYNETDCVKRLTDFGGVLASSDHMPTMIGFGGIFNQTQTVNPDFYNWNRVFIAYCDGGSFSGDVEEVNPKTNIHRRGARIFNAIIKDLLAKGMKHAKNAILAGQSAGGLAVMLHCDKFRTKLPSAHKVKCLSDAGYFIQGKDIPGATEASMANPYRNIVAYHGMDKLLLKSCTSKMDAKSCLYPENFVEDVKTPLFLVNSAFDTYQIMQKVPMEKPNSVCLSNLTTCRPIDKQYMTVCLDGSPPAYYHDKGTGTGAKNWIVYLVGGAWCLNETECIDRATGDLGSSRHLNSTTDLFKGIISPNKTTNSEFYNWNKVFVVYCDGASFAGDVEEVNPKTNLHFRGARIFNAVIEDLLPKGLKDAHNAILAGHSAGALATILHCDQFSAQVPNVKRVKCISDSGFFIHGQELAGSILVDKPFDNMVELHGVAKFLPKSCSSKMDPRLCMFPENIINDIKTPLFLVNSAIDAFQIGNKVLDFNYWWGCISNLTTCTPSQSQLFKDFRTAFLKAMPKGDTSSKLGWFIDSCFAHDHIDMSQRWNSPLAPTLKNKTVAQAFGDWYFDRSSFREIEALDHPRLCPWQ